MKWCSLSEKQRAKAIVPIRCGSLTGTAFLVADGKLLTARHVVDEFYNSGKPIVASFEGKYYNFTPQKVGTNKKAIDVVVLSCNDIQFAGLDTVAETTLKLMSIPFTEVEGEKLSVIGYPKELGGCSCQIETVVCPHTSINEDSRKYDVVTVRVGAFELQNYGGFSGSPILTKDGYVVGLVSTETFGKLTYCSVWRMEKRLKTLGIKGIETNWEAHDDSKLSLSLCEKQVEDAIQRAGGRYHEKEHTPNQSIEEFIWYFTDITKKDRTIESLKSLVVEAEQAFNSALVADSVVDKLPADISFKFTGVDYEKIPEHIDALRNYIKPKTTYRGVLKRLKDSANQLLAKYDIMQKQFLCLYGNAGMGKTQLSCFMARRLANERRNNVYLLFGSMFETGMDAWDKMLELLKISEEDIKSLQRRSEKNEHYAVFIIDALNEGVGDTYWKQQLGLLIKRFQQYPNLKLVFTIREPFTSRITESLNDKLFKKIKIDGFTSVGTNKAIDKYFSEFDVDPNYRNKYKKLFQKPLFLIVFCEAYRMMKKDERDNVNLRTLYETYLTSRNGRVSELADEDEKRNVTLECMRELALFSVNQCLSGLIPRDNARRIADKICPMRTWTNNLLHALLTENLLMETLSDLDDEDMVMFEFENIADVMKAEGLLMSKLTDSQILSLLIRTENELERQGLAKAKFENMVRALIALWDRKTAVTDIVEFTTGRFAIQMVKAREEYQYERNYKLISNWIKGNKEKYHPHELLSHLDDDNSKIVETLHPYLKNMEMYKRDEEWTIMVNDFVESHYALRYLARMSRNLKYRRRFLIIATWMLTTSDPDARMFIIRLLYRLLAQRTEDITWLLEQFPACNDHYVLQGMYCAIYGVSLRSRDKALLGEIAETVYKRYYEHDKNVPVDIVLRQWTLKILERAFVIEPNADYFKRIQLPFKSRNPYDGMLKNEIPAGYFGTEKGASFLRFSLSESSDFHRYVLGSNSFSDSSEFFLENDEDGFDPVSLLDIPKMMAPIIRNKYKYSEELARYDGERYSKDRHHNKTERIGKKYQWLALYQVYARLTDYCWVKDQRIDNWRTDVEGEGLTRSAWPWMTKRYDRFDPTLPSNEEIGKYAQSLKIEPESDGIQESEAVDNNVWLTSELTNPVIQMQWKGETGSQWVRIYGFESVNKKIDIENRGTMLYYNSSFVQISDSKKMSKWAKKQSFNGRWMAERSDCIEFLWNEMPWSDSYKRLNRNEWEDGYENNPYPCKLMVAYDEQLQEDNYGFLKEEEYNSYSVAIPCADLMEVMDLYTAERGLVRKLSDDSVAAISMDILQKGTGLLVRKDILCDYMQKRHLHLYTFILGSKHVNMGPMTDGKMEDLSACMLMNEEGEWTEVQKLHIVERKENKPIVADPNRIAFLREKNHKEGLTNLELLELLEMERKLGEQQDGTEE